MQQGVLYTIFLLLATGVGVALFVSYRVVGIPHNTQQTLQKSFQNADNASVTYETEIQKSWLREMREEQSHRTYFYTVTQLQLKLY